MNQFDIPGTKLVVQISDTAAEVYRKAMHKKRGTKEPYEVLQFLASYGSIEALLNRLPMFIISEDDNPPDDFFKALEGAIAKGVLQ